MLLRTAKKAQPSLYAVIRDVCIFSNIKKINKIKIDIILSEVRDRFVDNKIQTANEEEVIRIIYNILDIRVPPAAKDDISSWTLFLPYEASALWVTFDLRVACF